MAVRKKVPKLPKIKPCCEPGEIEIRGKCYNLYLVASPATLRKGADCGARFIIPVSEEFGGIRKAMLGKSKSAPSKKRK